MIGIDIVEISRVGRLRDEYGDKFLRKVFTEGEILSVEKKKGANQSLAGRFAAKEAFMKAFGRRLPWTGIEVRSGEKGKPFIVFEGTRFEGVSISHERTFAVAVVLI
jgi:holo-[acyl-carrier protein] synthase